MLLTVHFGFGSSKYPKPVPVYNLASMFINTYKPVVTDSAYSGLAYINSFPELDGYGIRVIDSKNKVLASRVSGSEWNFSCDSMNEHGVKVSYQSPMYKRLAWPIPLYIMATFDAEAKTSESRIVPIFRQGLKDLYLIDTKGTKYDIVHKYGESLAVCSECMRDNQEIHARMVPGLDTAKNKIEVVLTGDDSQIIGSIVVNMRIETLPSGTQIKTLYFPYYLYMNGTCVAQITCDAQGLLFVLKK